MLRKPHFNISLYFRFAFIKNSRIRVHVSQCRFIHIPCVTFHFVISQSIWCSFNFHYFLVFRLKAESKSKLTVHFETKLKLNWFQTGTKLKLELRFTAQRTRYIPPHSLLPHPRPSHHTHARPLEPIPGFSTPSHSLSLLSGFASLWPGRLGALKVPSLDYLRLTFIRTLRSI